jgi:hypothetical protein
MWEPDKPVVVDSSTLSTQEAWWHEFMDEFHISRLFEWIGTPQMSPASQAIAVGRRCAGYTHIRQRGDKYATWQWLQHLGIRQAVIDG